MRLELGIYDPFSTAWENEYYPLDLPPDWRLDYLANDYRVCVVPAQRLVGGDLACPPGLRGFIALTKASTCDVRAGLPASGWAGRVLEPDSAQAPSDLDRSVGIPAPDEAGWRWVRGEYWLVKYRVPAPFDLREIRRRIDALEAATPADATVLLAVDGDPNHLEQIKVMLALLGY
ncbi:MAG: hypothetical protein ACFCUG_07295 [Thiotrichales bacterium]